MCTFIPIGTLKYKGNLVYVSVYRIIRLNSVKTNSVTAFWIIGNLYASCISCNAGGIGIRDLIITVKIDKRTNRLSAIITSMLARGSYMLASYSGSATIALVILGIIVAFFTGMCEYCFTDIAFAIRVCIYTNAYNRVVTSIIAKVIAVVISVGADLLSALVALVILKVIVASIVSYFSTATITKMIIIVAIGMLGNNVAANITIVILVSIELGYHNVAHFDVTSILLSRSNYYLQITV